MTPPRPTAPTAAELARRIMGRMSRPHCRNCDGEGEVAVRDFQVEGDGRSTCSACGGTGAAPDEDRHVIVGALVAAVRAEALEEAAKVVDAYADRCGMLRQGSPMYIRNASGHIRALVSK